MNIQDAQNIPTDRRCGFVALCGRPNVGKSTLFNRLIGHHWAAVTHKAQTTRHNIQGVLTESDTQIIFMDSPGLNQSIHHPWNQMLNRNAKAAMLGVDLVMLVVDSRMWTASDDVALKIIQSGTAPCVLVLNKTDLLKKKQSLLTTIDKIRDYGFSAIVPLSARRDKNFDNLKTEVKTLLPQADFIFKGDPSNHQRPKVIVQELIYEQVMRYLHEEIPYTMDVEVSTVEIQEKRLRIEAFLWVLRDNQRPIVIGKQGSRLKTIGTAARKAIEGALSLPTYLKLNVKTQTAQHGKRMFQERSDDDLAVLEKRSKTNNEE